MTGKTTALPSTQKMSGVDVADQRVDLKIQINSVSDVTELLGLTSCHEQAMDDVALTCWQDVTSMHVRLPERVLQSF